MSGVNLSEQYTKSYQVGSILTSLDTISTCNYCIIKYVQCKDINTLKPTHRKCDLLVLTVNWLGIFIFRLLKYLRIPTSQNCKLLNVQFTTHLRGQETLMVYRQVFWHQCIYQRRSLRATGSPCRSHCYVRRMNEINMHTKPLKVVLYLHGLRQGSMHMWGTARA